MRITQAFVSDSVADFPFKKALNLTDYVDSLQPLVVFGVYSDRDMEVILAHKSKVLIVWCGQDAIDCIFMGRYQYLKNCIHVTWLPNVERALKSFLHIKLITPVFLGGNFWPSTLGNRVFVYAPSSFPKYHGIDLVYLLNDRFPDLNFYIGHGNVNQSLWLSGIGDDVYNKCFIGLCLSGFAGGGQTIMQMGLKGMTVVTNVLHLPNTKMWADIEDICDLIDQEREKVGTVQTKLAESVETMLKKDQIWLNV